MDPRKLHSEYGLDQRLADAGCAYCGSAPEGADHVPSKALLDDPLPDDLPVVPACKQCNQGVSADEQYLACFLECVVSGSTDPERIVRPKVARALRRSPALAAMIASTCTESAGGQLIWTPDMERVERVVLKLARGHHLFELSSPQLEQPASIDCVPLIAMCPERRKAFESPAGLPGWPEIGSRAFLRGAGIELPHSAGAWVDVQRSRYRYSVRDGGWVRIVIREYLACEVVWG